MKIQNLILTAMAATALVVTGCNKSPDAGAPTGGEAGAAAASVDTSKLEAVFATADAATKSAVDTAVASLKNADYSGAVTQLKSLGEKFKLTADQQAAVDELIAKAQKVLSEAAGKVAEEAGKAVTDMTKSLGK